jgi:predicted nucleic-acid-binding protein
VIGLDTNVLVRYLAQDDPAQSPRANRIIEHELTVAEPGFISVVALVETVWVLQRAYHFSRDDVAAVLQRLLQIESLVVAHEAEVFVAMTAFADGLGDFADALLAALNAAAGCRHTLTFDRRAMRLGGFRLA